MRNAAPGIEFKAEGMIFEPTTYSDKMDFLNDVWNHVFTTLDSKVRTSLAIQRANEAQEYAEHFWNRY